MSRFLTPARPGPTADRTRTDRRTPAGRGLLAVRLGWATLAALIVGLFAAGLPSEFAQLQTPCPTPVCTTGQLSPAGLQALTDLGLSPRFYAAATVAMDIVFAAGYAVVGALIFWRRPNDRGRRVRLRGAAALRHGDVRIHPAGPGGRPPGLANTDRGAALSRRGLLRSVPVPVSRRAVRSPLDRRRRPSSGSAGSWPSTSFRPGPPTRQAGRFSSRRWSGWPRWAP